MSAYVLLNLLNKLRERDKMRGLPGIFFLFSQQVYLVIYFLLTNYSIVLLFNN